MIRNHSHSQTHRSLCFLILALSGLGLASCDRNPPATNPATNNVRIITFKSHEVLDALVKSTVESLVNDAGVPREQIQVFNPNGKTDEIQAYVRTLSSRTTQAIVAVSTPSAQAALAARHPTIPLIYSFVSNPQVLNLGAAGTTSTNVTGISNVLDYEQGFSLLTTILPQLSRIAVLYNPSEENSVYSHAQIKLVAEQHTPPVTVISRPFTKVDELQSLVAALPDVDAIYVGGDNTLVANIALLLSVANTRRIPVFASDEGSVKAGAIAAFSIDYADFGRAAAQLTAEVLKKRTADGIVPVAYRKGRCIVNVSALTLLGVSFDPQAHNCVVVP